MSSQVEQIKSRLSIVDVVQSYIKLQKAGVNFKACCPFHSEKTPSFIVSPSRESWHCFGCGKGGDILSFVMEIEGLEFPEALKILADRAGIELKQVDAKYKSEHNKLLKLIEDAKKFYEAELKKNKEVISYLKKRGLKGETAKTFGVGFALEGWRNLYEHLKLKKYSDIEIEKAGMVIKSEKGHYDRFRNRIMFPLFNSSGYVVGFSGRVFGEETETSGGKYINSPQTTLYDKSKILYGFDKAKNEIRKKDYCILVEGQMDVIMSHQAGFTNTVAVSGTSLTKDHLVIIKRLTENIVMAFDKDEAGLNAAKRGIDLALAGEFEVKVAVVPSGKDPADAIKENPKEWETAILNAKPVIEFYLNTVKERKDISKTILPRIAVLPSEIEQAHWVAEIAKRLSIKEEPVWSELKRISSLRQDIESKEAPLISKTKKTQSRLDTLNNRLIGFILWQKKTKDKDFKTTIDKVVKKKKLNLEAQDKEKNIFEAESFYANHRETDFLKREFENLVSEVEKEEIKARLLEITKKIREFETNKNEVELEKILNKFYKLTQQLNELK